MKKLKFAVLPVVILLIACATGSDGFSVEDTGSKTVVMTVIGEIGFDGYYFPSSDDTVEISIVSDSGFVLSSQKIMNVTKFPIRFVLRYDASEVSKLETYQVIAVLNASGGNRTSSADVLLDVDKESVVLSF